MNVNVAFSTELIIPKNLTPCGLNLHFYTFYSSGGAEDKRSQGETQKTVKIDGFQRFPPPTSPNPTC
jgi:hypothetical protein